MANHFGADILIQSPEPAKAAAFYVDQLGFTITETSDQLISLLGDRINLYIERGPTLGPILEVFVRDVQDRKQKLIAAGCVVIKDEPDVPRVYLRDPNGLIYNLAERR